MKQLGGLGNTTKNNDERVVSAGEYNALKLKECTGQLTQPEFDKLLILDFNNLLAALPPILQPTEEIFDASKELAKVRVTPKANRRAVLENFKKKLFTQREAVAQCTVLLERALEFNPDTPPPDLRKIWHRFMATYRLGVESNSRIRQLIDDYYETREKMLGVRKQITDDKALVTAVTGVDVDSPNLKIVVGAMAFEIETDSINAHRIRNAITGEALPQDPSAFFGESRKIPGIYFIVLNMNNEAVANTSFPIEHERQHAKNRLFRKIFDAQIDFMDMNAVNPYSEALKEEDPDIRAVLLEQYIHIVTNPALNSVKNEIIAMKRDGVANNFERLYDQSENNPYDFTRLIRLVGFSKDPALWKKVEQKVLIDEYRQIIERALEAFDMLKKNRTTENTIALLINEPLPRWPKTVSRLLKQKYV